MFFVKYNLYISSSEFAIISYGPRLHDKGDMELQTSQDYYLNIGLLCSIYSSHLWKLFRKKKNKRTLFKTLLKVNNISMDILFIMWK